MKKKSLPTELADEEGIPEAIDAFRNALYDPEVRALLEHRKKFLAQEARRFEIVYGEEFRDAFEKVVRDALKKMGAQEMTRPLISVVRKKAKAHISSSAGGRYFR